MPPKTLAGKRHPSLVLLYSFFPTITENELLYLNILEQKEVKTKPWHDRGSGMGNSDFALTVFHCPGLKGSLQALWWLGQAMWAAAVHGEGQGALNPCCFQRKVELRPEWNYACVKQRWVSFDKWVCSGFHPSLPPDSRRSWDECYWDAQPLEGWC